MSSTEQTVNDDKLSTSEVTPLVIDDQEPEPQPQLQEPQLQEPQQKDSEQDKINEFLVNLLILTVAKNVGIESKEHINMSIPWVKNLVDKITPLYKQLLVDQNNLKSLLVWMQM